MTRDILIDLLGREPFEPLSLRLSDSSTLKIDSPGSVRVGRNYLVMDADSGRRLTVTLHHILAVESVSEPKLEPHELPKDAAKVETKNEDTAES